MIHRINQTDAKNKKCRLTLDNRKCGLAGRISSITRLPEKILFDENTPG